MSKESDTSAALRGRTRRAPALLPPKKAAKGVAVPLVSFEYDSWSVPVTGRTFLAVAQNSARIRLSSESRSRRINPLVHQPSPLTSQWKERSGRITKIKSSCVGFTLIELLTVMAIIGVLATPLVSALASAKRKARQVASTSNLRQITLGLNMYLDDHQRKPSTLGTLVSAAYLPALGILLCPEDKTGNWGGLIQQRPTFPPPSALTPAQESNLMFATPDNRADEIPNSYLNPLAWEDTMWNQLLNLEPSAGIAACQLHGLGKPNLSSPSIRDFEGLLLRGQLDGAVVRRQVYWDTPQETIMEAPLGLTMDAPLGVSMGMDAARESALAPAPNTESESIAALAPGPPPSTGALPWRLFTDKTPPQ